MLSTKAVTAAENCVDGVAVHVIPFGCIADIGFNHSRCERHVERAVDSKRASPLPPRAGGGPTCTNKRFLFTPQILRLAECKIARCRSRFVESTALSDCFFTTDFFRNTVNVHVDLQIAPVKLHCVNSCASCRESNIQHQLVLRDKIQYHNNNNKCVNPRTAGG